MIQIYTVLDAPSITMMDDVSALGFVCLLMKVKKTNELIIFLKFRYR